MHIDNELHRRGSKTARVKSARIAPGDRLYTTDALAIRFENGRAYFVPDEPGLVQPTTNKGQATIRVVASTESQLGRASIGRRAQRTYTVYFTDGTKAVNQAPVQTWDALVLDTESSASRQHQIDTGWYLSPAEVAEYADAV